MLDRARAAPAARGAAVTPESKSGVLTLLQLPAKFCPQTSGTATVAQTCKELIRGGLLPEKDVLAETDYGGKWGVIVNVSCDYQEENKTQLPRQLHEEIEQATTASPMLTHLNQQQETQICHVLKEVATLFATSPRRTMLGKQIISLKDGHQHPYQFIQHLLVQSAGMIFVKDGSLHRLLGGSTPYQFRDQCLPHANTSASDDLLEKTGVANGTGKCTWKSHIDHIHIPQQDFSRLYSDAIHGAPATFQ